MTLLGLLSYDSVTLAVLFPVYKIISLAKLEKLVS
jgi:hypothetical protein